MKELETKYNDIQKKINKYGWSFNIYEKNLKLLLNSKTIEDYLNNYKNIQNDGRNTIDLYYLIDDNTFELKKDKSLEDLKMEAWKAVIEYSESELEAIKESN